MPDLGSVETLMTAAAGGLITLAGKYVVDRLTETHKAKLAATAKRKERFHEMQTEAIVGMFARSKKALHKIAVVHEDDITDGLLSESATGRIRADLEGASEVRADLDAFEDSHGLFLPGGLRRSISDLNHRLNLLEIQKWILVRAEPADRVMSCAQVEAMRSEHMQLIGLLVQLQDAARRALRS